jgi:RNA polymerase sigma-70 factor (ECF subfamily)
MEPMPLVRREPLPSFQELYASNFRLVWRVLCRMGVPSADLEDAAQEVFATAYRRLRDFEGRSSVRTWLVGIALRIAADARRMRRPHEVLSPALTDTRPDPERSAAAHESMGQLEAVLDTLDTEKREVFVLAEIEQWTVPEISAALGINVNTAYTRLRAARIAFNRAIEAKGEHHG